MAKFKKFGKLVINKIYVIYWIDAVGQGGEWQNKKEKINSVKCKTVGILHQNEKEDITIVQTISDDEGIYNLMSIPKGMITNIKGIAENDL